MVPPSVSLVSTWLVVSPERNEFTTIICMLVLRGSCLESHAGSSIIFLLNLEMQRVTLVLGGLLNFVLKVNWLLLYAFTHIAYLSIYNLHCNERESLLYESNASCLDVVKLN